MKSNTLTIHGRLFDNKVGRIACHEDFQVSCSCMLFSAHVNCRRQLINLVLQCHVSFELAMTRWSYKECGRTIGA